MLPRGLPGLSGSASGSPACERFAARDNTHLLHHQPVEVAWNDGGEAFTALLAVDNIVVEANATFAFEIDCRFDIVNHAGLQDVF